MPKKKSKKNKDKKKEDKDKDENGPSLKQKHNQEVFKKAVEAYRLYKNEHENGTKKLATFIKEAFGKK